MRKLPDVFIKSVGGKSAIADQIIDLMPPGRRFRYHEPFLGGGAVFLALARADRISRAHLGDANPDLVAAWNAVVMHQGPLRAQLARMVLNDEEFYLRTRARDSSRMSTVARGARFIYLNKQCWGGLWRTNADGQMNTPFGKGRNLQRLYDPENLDAIRKLWPTVMRDPAVEHEDFGEVLGLARKGDVAYFDPPYIPVSKGGKNRSFTKYTAGDFTMADQERLRDVAATLARRGVRVVISQSSAPESLELYAGRPFEVRRVHARRSVNSRGDDRGEVPEILVTAGPAR